MDVATIIVIRQRLCQGESSPCEGEIASRGPGAAMSHRGTRRASTQPPTGVRGERGEEARQRKGARPRRQRAGTGERGSPLGGGSPPPEEPRTQPHARNAEEEAHRSAQSGGGGERAALGEADTPSCPPPGRRVRRPSAAHCCPAGGRSASGAFFASQAEKIHDRTGGENSLCSPHARDSHLGA